MRGQFRTVDEVIGRIASNQVGVVARRQLLGAGISAKQIDRRARRGLLIPVYRGVYRVGHAAPSLEAFYMAAVLACGPLALLRGQAAGHLFGLLPGGRRQPEVVSPTARRIGGVRTRRCRNLDRRDATRFHGIPVTTVPRTVVDLAAVLDQGQLARACHEAEVRHRVAPRHVEAVLARRPTSPGAAKLRRVLHGDVPVALSGLERRFLELLREHGLPPPRTNRLASGRRVDCRWPERRLTVELDGYRYHRSRHAWERDRRREREAHARGDDFRRYTYGDVVEDSRAMLAELRALLLGRSGRARRAEGEGG